ncbi:helix-turn-helix domain-containing protein [Saccharopolyspora flava]|uniref:Helix-turn-helix domain-containing protein n=1 Tax=Saccharopolyspora flava TaxID=95161 RepID=A0A1I6U3P2_9PSEU|nr:helix-turn-helix transcriptional regulator [Saccharopolyspora flava]SFS96055.1 Helix-turn-helix domain-containing protein [Saccharopolyspora flava]
MATTPTVRRLLLSNELKRLREQAGVDADKAAQHLGCRTTKISRIELAQSSIQAGDVKLLTELYGADADHAEVLLDLARGQNQRGRWTGYRALYPDWFRLFVDLERDAAVLKSVEVEVVPGLLQTENYIQALFENGHTGGTDEYLENSVMARKERQTIFTRREMPQLSFILSESCLRRAIGGPGVMREQLLHLVEVGRRRNVQIQVLPFNARTYAGQAAYRFTLLNIPASGVSTPLDFVYVESHDDARYLDAHDAVASYGALWDRLQAAALGPVESREFLAEVAEQVN